jgi:hypothetical protein
MLGVVILAWMNGSYFLASLWGTLGLLMVLEKLNRHYGWIKRKDQKDLTSLMEERHRNRTGVK